jgi:hypothetical protein
MLSERPIAASCQDVIGVLYNQQLDYHIQNSPSVILVTCHFNPVHTSTPCFSRLYRQSITQQVHVVIPPWNGTREVLNSNLGQEPGYSGGGRRLVVFSVPSGPLRGITSIRSSSHIPKFLPTPHYWLQSYYRIHVFEVLTDSYNKLHKHNKIKTN